MNAFLRYGIYFLLIVLSVIFVVRYLLKSTFAMAMSRVLLVSGFGIILWSFYRDWTMNHSRSDWDTLVMIVLWGTSAVLLCVGLLIRHIYVKKERQREESVVRHFYREEELKMEKLKKAQEERMQRQGKERYD